MTMTEERTEAVVDAANELTLENCEWVTVTGAQVRRDWLLPEFPLKVLRRRLDEYNLELPFGFGLHERVQHNTDKIPYIRVPMRHLAPAASGPTDEQLTPGLPEDLTKLSQAQLATEFATYRARTERTIKHLHRHADTHGMCDTFDNIMERSGWPRRPRMWSVNLSAQWQRKMTADDFITNFVGKTNRRKFDGLGTEITITEEVQVSAQFESAERPKKTDPVSQYLDQSTISELFAHFGGVDLSTVKISAV